MSADEPLLDRAIQLASRGFVNRAANIERIPSEVRTMLRELVTVCRARDARIAEYAGLLRDREQDLGNAYRDMDALAREALEAERDRDG